MKLHGTRCVDRRTVRRRSHGGSNLEFGPSDKLVRAVCNNDLVLASRQTREVHGDLVGVLDLQPTGLSSLHDVGTYPVACGSLLRRHVDGQLAGREGGAHAALVRVGQLRLVSNGRHRGLGRPRSSRRRGRARRRGRTLGRSRHGTHGRQLRIVRLRCGSGGRLRRGLNHRVRSGRRSGINGRLDRRSGLGVHRGGRLGRRLVRAGRRGRRLVRVGRRGRRIIGGSSCRVRGGSGRRIVDIVDVRTIHHHRIGDRIGLNSGGVAAVHHNSDRVHGSGLPCNPLDVVRAIGNGRHDRRIIKRGSSPQIGVVRRHGLIVTGESRTLQRRDLSMIQDQSPKSGLDVCGSEV